MSKPPAPTLPVAGRIEPPLAPGVPSTTGADFLTTKLDWLVEWAHSNSLWPLPFGTACCAIEFMSVVSSHYDLSRFGAEVVRFSPRQADVMIVAGTVTDKLAPVLRKVYDQMADPKWVISMGVCACTGGFYRAYHVVQGIDEIVPVDVYVAGCPPTPENLMRGVLELQKKIRSGELARHRENRTLVPIRVGENPEPGIPGYSQGIMAPHRGHGEFPAMPETAESAQLSSPAPGTPSGRAESVQASPARGTPSGRAESVQAAPARGTPSGRADVVEPGAAR